MSDVYRATIPYESLDPLTIGAADDESKVYRDTLELEIPQANLIAAIYPESRLPARRDRCDGAGAREPGHRAEILELIRAGSPSRS